MTNAEKFGQLFGLYATELWSKHEKDFLAWLNMEYTNVPDINVGDMISRQAAIDMVIKRDANCGIDSAEVLKLLPSIEPRKGKWDYTDDMYETYKCSECGFNTDDYIEYNFCPNCGCRMEEGEQK